jgi:hypothetical protein
MRKLLGLIFPQLARVQPVELSCAQNVIERTTDHGTALMRYRAKAGTEIFVEGKRQM